jgi:hypothetical protein
MTSYYFAYLGRIRPAIDGPFASLDDPRDYAHTVVIGPGTILRAHEAALVPVLVIGEGGRERRLEGGDGRQPGPWAEIGTPEWRARWRDRQAQKRERTIRQMRAMRPWDYRGDERDDRQP